MIVAELLDKAQQDADGLEAWISPEGEAAVYLVFGSQAVQEVEEAVGGVEQRWSEASSRAASH